MIASSKASLIGPGSARAPFVSAGMFKVLMTPLKSWPLPIGTFNGTQALPNIARISFSSAGKSIFSESILLMMIIRPRPALPAS